MSKKIGAESVDELESQEESDEFPENFMLLFHTGDQLLSRWRDGLGYVATIEKVSILFLSVG